MMLLMVITCVNKWSNEKWVAQKSKERKHQKWHRRRSSAPNPTNAVFVCVLSDSLCFHGTFLGHSIWVLGGKSLYFSQQCLSEKYRALVLFIGQISSESEVFWVRMFLRVKKNTILIHSRQQQKKFSLEFREKAREMWFRGMFESSRSQLRVKLSNYVEIKGQKKRCVSKKFYLKAQDRKSCIFFAHTEKFPKEFCASENTVLIMRQSGAKESEWALKFLFFLCGVWREIECKKKSFNII